MPEKLSWASSIKVENGPVISLADSPTPDAYAKLNVVIGGESTGDIEIAPSSPATLQFLAIKLQNPDAGGPVTYSPDAGTTTYALDSGHVYSSPGQLTALGPASTLQIANGGTADVTVEILVAWNVT